VTELHLRVNGIHNAWAIELGLATPRDDHYRARDPYRLANVSFSALQRKGGRIVHHTLIDVGLGVVPSLLDLERSHGAHQVDDLLLSHSHFDHLAELDWLSNGLKRNRRPEQPRPLPVYATRECAAAGPRRVFPWLGEDLVRYLPLEPERPLVLGELTVTPLPVEHAATAPGAVLFVLQWRASPSGAPHRVVLSCDFLRIPRLDHPLLQGAEVMVLDANTWHPCPDSGHSSILEDLSLIRRLRPRRSYLVHYSGYEDLSHPESPVNGPLDPERLESALEAARGELDVRLARHGMILGEDEPWPA
jgi:phosphoribosyl 1,2-cyclic phosphodiesterase